MPAKPRPSTCGLSPATNALRSMPAQNEPPAPVRTPTLSSSSASSSSSAAATPCASALLTALRAWGRLRVISRTPSRRSVSTGSSLMGGDPSAARGALRPFDDPDVLGDRPQHGIDPLEELGHRRDVEAAPHLLVAGAALRACHRGQANVEIAEPPVVEVAQLPMSGLRQQSLRPADVGAQREHLVERLRVVRSPGVVESRGIRPGRVVGDAEDQRRDAPQVRAEPVVEVGLRVDELRVPGEVRLRLPARASVPSSMRPFTSGTSRPVSAAVAPRRIRSSRRATATPRTT